MTRCETCDLIVGAGCGCHVKDPRPRRSPVEQQERFSIRARFSSTLACGHPADEGDWITRTPDGYVCKECASE